MAPVSDASQRRKLDMHKMPAGRHAITVQCNKLSIQPEQAAELLRDVHFVTDVTLVENDTRLIVSYDVCTLGRIKQNVFNHLGQYLI